ncbi:MAG: sigma-70 family RNA polymerase sigma factor [Elusimicrobia bacterium]|nr:sigma-70 family RNA polymerase sigma factor [Candidatus Liberimonas magnetica]
MSNLNFFSLAQQAKQIKLLTETEIRELLKKDRDKALEIIILRTMRLVCNYVFRYMSFSKKYGIQLEDLYQTGCLALTLAVSKHSFNRGYFYHYVTKVIKAYIFNEIFSKNFGYSRRLCIKKMKLHQDINPTDSLEKIILDNTEDGHPLLLQDIIPSQEDSNAYLIMEVNNLLSKLSRDQKAPHKLSREVIELRYSIGPNRRYLNKPMSHVEVGHILNISKETVRKIELKTIEYLRTL